MTPDQLRKPQTTFRRAFAALTLCVTLIALAMTLVTISGWHANSAFGPSGMLEAIGAAFFVGGLWLFNVAMFFALFAALPWAILHFLGLRSWWIAPVAGFCVAFAIAYFMTAQGGHSYLELQTSTWINGKATMIKGRLTPYGESLYGPIAAVRNGMVFGAIGSVVALVLWRIAYRRK